MTEQGAAPTVGPASATGTRTAKPDTAWSIGASHADKDEAARIWLHLSLWRSTNEIRQYQQTRTYPDKAGAAMDVHSAELGFMPFPARQRPGRESIGR